MTENGAAIEARGGRTSGGAFRPRYFATRCAGKSRLKACLTVRRSRCMPEDEVSLWLGSPLRAEVMASMVVRQRSPNVRPGVTPH